MDGIAFRGVPIEGCKLYSHRIRHCGTQSRHPEKSAIPRSNMASALPIVSSASNSKCSTSSNIAHRASEHRSWQLVIGSQDPEELHENRRIHETPTLLLQALQQRLRGRRLNWVVVKHRPEQDVCTSRPIKTGHRLQSGDLRHGRGCPRRPPSCNPRWWHPEWRIPTAGRTASWRDGCGGR